MVPLAAAVEVGQVGNTIPVVFDDVEFTKYTD